MTFGIYNVIDLLDIIGEEEVQMILSDFSCSKNKEIEYFVQNNTINFAKQKNSITYLIMDENAKLVAIFTLTHKAIQISNVGLSKRAQKRLNASPNSTK